MGTGCEVGVMSSNALLDYVISRLCARDFRSGGKPELWIPALEKRKNILSCSATTVYVAKSKLQGNLNELWQSLLDFYHIKPRYLARGRDIPRFVGMYLCWMEEIGFLPESIKSRSYSGTNILLFSTLIVLACWQMQTHHDLSQGFAYLSVISRLTSAEIFISGWCRYFILKPLSLNSSELLIKSVNAQQMSSV